MVMGVKACGQCDFVGPEFPAEDLAREVHRGLHELGRRFLEVLDPIVAAFAVPKIKPLADLDGFDVDRNKAVFRGEVPPGGELPLVMGGRIVGVSIFDGKGGMRGTVTDPDAIAALFPPAGGLVSFVEQEVVGEPLTPWQKDVLRRWER